MNEAFLCRYGRVTASTRTSPSQPRQRSARAQSTPLSIEVHSSKSHKSHVLPLFFLFFIPCFLRFTCITRTHLCMRAGHVAFDVATALCAAVGQRAAAVLGIRGAHRLGCQHRLQLRLDACLDEHQLRTPPIAPRAALVAPDASGTSGTSAKTT